VKKIVVVHLCSSASQ